jgi:hypothetical protein
MPVLKFIWAKPVLFCRITKNGENQTLNRSNIGFPLSHCQNRCVNPTAGRVVQRNPAAAAAKSPSTGSEPPSVASLIIIISTSCWWWWRWCCCCCGSRGWYQRAVKRERRGRGRRYRHGLSGTSRPQNQFSFPRLLVLSSSSELRAAPALLSMWPCKNISHIQV